MRPLLGHPAASAAERHRRRVRRGADHPGGPRDREPVRHRGGAQAGRRGGLGQHEGRAVQRVGAAVEAQPADPAGGAGGGQRAGVAPGGRDARRWRPGRAAAGLLPRHAERHLARARLVRRRRGPQRHPRAADGRAAGGGRRPDDECGAARAAGRDGPLHRAPPPRRRGHRRRHRDGARRLRAHGQPDLQRHRPDGGRGDPRTPPGPRAGGPDRLRPGGIGHRPPLGLLRPEPLHPQLQSPLRRFAARIPHSRPIRSTIWH